MHVLQNPSRLGMVDLLIGLLAAVSEELRSRISDKVVSVEQGWFFRNLLKLANKPAYADDLRCLEEEGFGNIWSQMITWQMVDVENAGRAIIMRQDQASRRLGWVGRQYGLPAVEKLRHMANELLNMSHQYNRHP